MKKAFTITELLVAVGLLAAVIMASSMIFHYSIEAQRTASATAEIMRTLRAITDQLNSDFANIRTDAPLMVGFNRNPDGLRADSIAFFASGGNFETTNLYYNNSKTVSNSDARIYYGQVRNPDPNDANNPVRKIKILARKQVILTSDPLSLVQPNVPDANDANKTYEYEFATFGEQVTNYGSNPGFFNELWLYRPVMDFNDGNDIPIYLAKGVDDFSIMLDADVNGTILPLPPTPTHKIDWWQVNGTPEDMNMNDYLRHKHAGYPNLIKFTFTLYDSKGILKGGRKFEYIVHVGK